MKTHPSSRLQIEFTHYGAWIVTERQTTPTGLVAGSMPVVAICHMKETARDCFHAYKNKTPQPQ
jgi:hypothetical protein